MVATNKIKSKLNEYWRVLKITKTPSREEFNIAFKITGIGMLLIGAIGFLAYYIMSFLKVF